LQRQTVALNKISNQFQEDLTKSQATLNKSFNLLRQLLNERQNQLQFKLNTLAQTGHDILCQRQAKAAQLKHLAENAIHLNDTETLELKADIKHFISERQLDEELARIKFFQEENLDKLTNSIDTFGLIAQIRNQYSTERPPLNELLNSASSPEPTPSKQPSQHQDTSQQTKFNNTTNNNNNNNKQNIHINSSNNFDDEGEFIEVKRPQRNRNNKQQQSQQNASAPNGATNGIPLTNGVAKQQSTSNNIDSNGRPYTNGHSAATAMNQINSNKNSNGKRAQKTDPASNNFQNAATTTKSLNNRTVANGH